MSVDITIKTRYAPINRYSLFNNIVIYPDINISKQSFVINMKNSDHRHRCYIPNDKQFYLGTCTDHITLDNIGCRCIKTLSTHLEEDLKTHGVFFEEGKEIHKKEIVFKSLKTMINERDNTCAICLEEVNIEDENLMILDCSHIFHTLCIRKDTIHNKTFVESASGNDIIFLKNYHCVICKSKIC